MNQKGFTLIELILYIALVSIFMTGAIFFTWDVIYGREKAFQQQKVEQSARAAMARIAYEIRRAKDINSIASASIELENGINDTTINLSSDAIQIGTAGVGPYRLTSNQVEASSLAFTELSSSDENTKNINVGLIVQQSSSVLSGQILAQASMSQSVELNSQFNDARSLLMNASTASLFAGNRRIINTTLQNSGANDITIDKITVSWTGTDGNENIKEITIDGIDVWTDVHGQPSGTELDITNVTLISEAAAIDIDKFDFTRSIEGAVVTIKYTMTDSSTTRVVIDFS